MIKNQKGISTLAGIVIVLAVAVFLFGAIFVWQYYNFEISLSQKEQMQNQNQENLVGNDKDEHGCIGSAGYSWCEAKQKCLRKWEEPCEEDISEWKTYTNTEYGFEIKYPASYGISIEKKEVGYYYYKPYQIVSMYLLENKNIDRTELRIMIGTSDEDVKNCLKNPNSYDYRVGYKENLTETKEVNGITFYIVGEKLGDAAMGGARGVVSHYNISHDNYCFFITSEVYYHLVGYAGYMNNGVYDATPEEMQAQQDEVDKNYKILEDILSTFKFTK